MNGVRADIALILSQSAELATWAVDNYGAITLFNGVDYEALPSKDDAPYIVINTDTETGGRGADLQTVGVSLSLSIYDETIDPVRGVLGSLGFKIANYPQIDTRENFKQLVIAALEAADDIDGYDIASITVDYEPIDFFPWFDCHIALELQQFTATREGWVIK